MKSFFIKFSRVLKIIFKVKYKINLPKKKYNLVLDLNNSYYFTSLFNKKKTFFLDTRFDDPEFAGTKNFQNELNLFVFIYSFFKYLSNKKYTLMQCYIISYIRFIDPKNIITFTDNNLFFF